MRFLFNPWARIKELEDELANLRWANERMKEAREKAKREREQERETVETLRDALQHLYDYAELGLRATEVDA